MERIQDEPDHWDDLPPLFRDDQLLQAFKELSRSKDSDRALVLITHGFLELMINALIDAKCKNAKKITSNNRDYPHSAKLLILHELGLLGDRDYRVLDWFRKIRNRAAHEPFFRVDKEDFAHKEDFAQIATTPREITDLYHVCMLLLVMVWNGRKDLLGPTFAPGVMGLKKQPAGGEAGNPA